MDCRAPRRIPDPSAPARTVGRRNFIVVGLGGPADQEYTASIANSHKIAGVPKGIHRYKSHEDANAAMDRWIVQAAVATSCAAARQHVLEQEDRDLLAEPEPGSLTERRTLRFARGRKNDDGGPEL